MGCSRYLIWVAKTTGGNNSRTLLGSIAGASIRWWQTAYQEKNKRSLLICVSCMHVGELSDEYVKRVVRTWRFYRNKEPYIFLEKWHDKVKGVLALRGSKLWDGKYLRKLMEDNSWFISFVVLVMLVPSVGWVASCLWWWRIILLFLVDRGRAASFLCVSASWQLYSAQNNPYVRVAYFGVAYTKLL